MKFFKYGIEIFDSSLKKYGGFNRWIAKLFGWKYSYLAISLHKSFKFNHIYNNDEYYYDGYHNSIQIGFLIISYGT